MKKLHIILMSMLAFGLVMYAKDSNVAMNDQAILALQKAASIEQARQQVLNVLEIDNPSVVNEIAIDEAQLEVSFQKILEFVRHVNKKITALSKSSNVEEDQIARFAAELALAEEAIDKGEASYIARHGKEKNDEEVRTELQKATAALSELQGEVVKSFEKAMQSKRIQKIKKAANRVRSKASRAIASASAQAQPYLQDAQDLAMQTYEQAQPYLQDATDFAIDAGNSVVDAGEQAIEYVQDWYNSHQ